MTSPPPRNLRAWVDSLQRWGQMAGWPMAISALMSLSTLLGLSLLYRGLPADEAGTLALLLSLSDILSLVALLGLGTTITRLYTTSGPGVFDWPIDMLATGAYALPVIGLGSAALVILYGFSAMEGVYLLVLTALGTLLTAAFSILNSSGHYAWSAFLIRAPNAFLILPGLAILLAVGGLPFSVVLLAFLVATVIALGLAVFLLWRFLPRGGRRITRKERREGLAFMLTSTTDMFPEQGLIAVAGSILPLRQLAAFAAMAVLMRPFRLVRSVLGTVLAPDLLRFRRSSYRKLVAGGWILGLGSGVAAAILVPPIASWLYGGRYQEALAWIPYLSLAGALLLAAVPPRVDLSVRGRIRTVNRFAVMYFLSMVASLSFSLLGLNLWGALFLGVSVVLLQLTEVGVAYAFWLGFRRSETRPSTT